MIEEPLPAGRVGIFWGLVQSRGELALITQSTPLAEAELYGECLTHSTSHYEAWEAWKANTSAIPEPAFATPVKTSEYEEHPRGRVVFSITENRFWIYVDRRLFTKIYSRQIATSFDIDDGIFTVRLDSHYR